MQVNGKPFMFSNDELRFSASQNDITIHYSAIDLSNGPETMYQYKLVGEDTNWITAGNQRQINFSHLSPGKYSFMVRSLNRAGDWNTMPAVLQFYIKPPFTQTVWFYILLLVGVAGYFMPCIVFA
jgi:predicted phage tail protein